MMEQPPAITGMCTTEYQGWIEGKHPNKDEGVVRRKVKILVAKTNLDTISEIAAMIAINTIATIATLAWQSNSHRNSIAVLDTPD